jgi:hypothetical protein
MSQSIGIGNNEDKGKLKQAFHGYDFKRKNEESGRINLTQI